MHAALVTANVPGGPNEARLKNLRERIVPRISAASGFVAGYWMAPVDDKALAVAVFDDEASARGAVPAAGSDMDNGVTIDTVEFRPVVANA